MIRLNFIVAILCAVATVGCGSNSLPGTSDKTPNLQGTWTVVLSGAAPSQGATPPPSTTLTVVFNQNGNTLVGSVVSVSNPMSSCISGISNTGTTFTISGNVTHPIEAGANLNLQMNFVSGSATGTITVTGAASDMTASGLFTVTPNSGCPGGGFGMTKVG